MRRHPLKRELALTALLAFVFAGCSSSNFASGGAGSKSGKNQKTGDEKSPDDKSTDKEEQSDPDEANGDSDDQTPTIDETTGIKTDPTGMIAEEGDQAKQLVPQFGLLANDLVCGVCHLSVNGDVISTSASVPEPHTGSRNQSVVNGAWFAAQDYGMSSGAVNVRDGVQKNYRGDQMPKDLDKDGVPDFPKIDFDGISGKMKGSVTSSKDEVKKVANGNIVLIGTDSDPIVIKGEVLIKGDLVIAGTYKGLGTIYVTGNAYIPADLRAQSSPFPYSTDKEEAKKRAKSALKDRLDGLAIASHRSVIVGNFEPLPGIHSVFERDDTPPEMRSGVLGTNGIIGWYPGGEDGVKSLFKPSAKPCGSIADRARAVSEIDAYLYAEKAVAGHSIGSSYSINGGVIADYFHIISAAEACPDELHPVHKQSANHSYVNFDYRMGEGLLLLKQMNQYFKTK